MENVDRAELAAFLRAWRARVQPADVGLPAGGRRRTPGLRRQEVAQLAGMSVEYYIRLEQGRGPRPSRQMIGAICRALRLSEDETAHLHHLVGEPPLPPSGLVRDVRPGVLHLLDRLDDTPALVCSAARDVLAWNAMAAALLGDFSALAPADRNLIWRYFTDPASRARHEEPDATRFSCNAVADLRAAAARYPADSGLRRLIERLLAASPEFVELWARQDVRVRRSSHKRIVHPVVGPLDLDCEALHDPHRDQWTIFYTAAPGTPSHSALRLLKVVGGQDMTVGVQNRLPAPGVRGQGRSL